MLDKAEKLQEVSQRIRLHRSSRGWSQEILAEKANLHPRYITRLENGETNFGVFVLFQVAAAFDITASELLKDI